eukprot:scaffold16321_cov39-Phaeocystis_antarctica.AAC.2
MRGCFSASHERFVSCGRAEVPISCSDKMAVEAPASDLPWGPRAAPAPVRGPRLLSMNKLSTKQGHSWTKQSV